MDTGLQVPEIIKMEDIPPYDTEDYDLFDEKDFRKYLNDVKRFVRNSYEYRALIKYLKQWMNMNEDSFFKNVSNLNSTKVQIELHHSPFLLEEIVTTVYNKRAFYNESLEVEMVAKEVVYLHYFLMVGLIPLSTTVHELVHSQNLFIPVQYVYGNWEEFYDIYKNWMDGDLIEKIENIKEKSRTYNEAANTAVLQQTYIPVQMIDTEQHYYLPTMEEMAGTMQNKLKEIREQNSRALTDSHYDNNVIDMPENNNLVVGMVYDAELVRGMTYETYR